MLRRIWMSVFPKIPISPSDTWDWDLWGNFRNIWWTFTAHVSFSCTLMYFLLPCICGSLWMFVLKDPTLIVNKLLLLLRACLTDSPTMHRTGASLPVWISGAPWKLTQPMKLKQGVCPNREYEKKCFIIARVTLSNAVISLLSVPALHLSWWMWWSYCRWSSTG